MNLGNKNPCVKYELESRELESILEENDFGVLITKDLKVSAQCSRAAKAANRVLGMIRSVIRRTFTCKDEQTVIQLYKSLVIPHLEYCVQVLMLLRILKCWRRCNVVPLNRFMVLMI